MNYLPYNHTSQKYTYVVISVCVCVCVCVCLFQFNVYNVSYRCALTNFNVTKWVSIARLTAKYDSSSIRNGMMLTLIVVQQGRMIYIQILLYNNILYPYTSITHMYSIYAMLEFGYLTVSHRITNKLDKFGQQKPCYLT